MAAYTFVRFSFSRTVTGVNKNAVATIAVRHASGDAKNDARVQRLLGERNPEASSNMSKSMKAYLKRAKENEDTMKQQIALYDIGKRHLANMMGMDADSFTQKDIDAAINYLFPSGLFDPRARPKMQHPKDVFPVQKEAAFDHTGRPYHFLFYTTKPNYYQILYDLAEHMEDLNKQEDAAIEKTKAQIPKEQADLITSEWMTKTDISTLIQENVSQAEYDYLISSLERLAQHPLSSRVTDFLTKYRNPLITVAERDNVLPIQKDENGQPYVHVELCQRKSAIAQVTVRGEGTGKITINGEGILYFPQKDHREQILFPLVMSNMLGKVDVEATVTGGGPTGQCGAIRWGIAWGLRSFVDATTMEKLRLAGLLTRDWRRRERKKYGQRGARAKYTWRKR